MSRATRVVAKGTRRDGFGTGPTPLGGGTATGAMQAPFQGEIG